MTVSAMPLPAYFLGWSLFFASMNYWRKSEVALAFAQLNLMWSMGAATGISSGTFDIITSFLALCLFFTPEEVKEP